MAGVRARQATESAVTFDTAGQPWRLGLTLKPTSARWDVAHIERRRIRQRDASGRTRTVVHYKVHYRDASGKHHTTTLDAVFNAWQNDRSRGLDSIMLAPTRELVSRLDQRARNHRLADTTPSQEIELGDGNAASVGDLIITRANDRRLRITATDWVKNGDRWTILNLTGGGGVRVRHVRNGRTVTLPAGYVSTATELGYASTVHTAQGVTADTVHGVVTGEESRQQLYTMLTRGRSANHIFRWSATGTRTP